MQRWILDNIKRTVGVDWDQGRTHSKAWINESADKPRLFEVRLPLL